MNSDDELIARARPRDPEPEPTQAQMEHKRALDDDLAASWNGAAGADPLVDRGLHLLRNRGIEVERIALEVARTRELAREGRLDPEEAERSINDQLTREEAQTTAAITDARKLVEVGRERLLTELLPEPAPNGTTTRERKEDISMTVGAHGKEVSDGFRDAFQRSLRRGDKQALGLLLGDWGEVLFRSRGGDPSTWASLRQGFVQEIANDVERRSPRTREAKAWAVVRDGGGAKRFIDGQGALISWKLTDIPRSGKTR